MDEMAWTSPSHRTFGFLSECIWSIPSFVIAFLTAIAYMGMVQYRTLNELVLILSFFPVSSFQITLDSK